MKKLLFLFLPLLALTSCEKQEIAPNISNNTNEVPEININNPEKSNESEPTYKGTEIQSWRDLE